MHGNTPVESCITSTQHAEYAGLIEIAGLGRLISDPQEVARDHIPVPGSAATGFLTEREASWEDGDDLVGLDGDEAALDIRDLRSLVDCIPLVRRTAMQTAVRMITTGVMLALLAGIALKLKIFGGSP